MLDMFEFVVVLGSFILVYHIYRQVRSPQLLNAGLAFLMLAVGSFGILARRLILAPEQHASMPFLFILDFGYMFAIVFFYKAMVR